MAWRYKNPTVHKTSKYGSHKTVVDGIEFDSKKEAMRYAELRTLEKAGAIHDLKMQVKFVLIPAQREADTIGARGAIRKGKIIERECAYVADFVYTDVETGETVVEDTKGFKTKDYIIKRKLMLWVHKIKIMEV
jgi:Fe2+ or Zn2+ uptake regulation protein